MNLINSVALDFLWQVCGGALGIIAIGSLLALYQAGAFSRRKQ